MNSSLPFLGREFLSDSTPSSFLQFPSTVSTTSFPGCLSVLVTQPMRTHVALIYFEIPFPWGQWKLFTHILSQRLTSFYKHPDLQTQLSSLECLLK